MPVHLSLGVTTLVAMMAADRAAARGLARNAEEAIHIDACLQTDMLPDEVEVGPVLCKAPHSPT
ncbi:MAG: hypothetical protein P4L71_04075 [Acetobacteraceae bacterium]|nr:hypothetical protein [Acetobacteraceae bacterium]